MWIVWTSEAFLWKTVYRKQTHLPADIFMCSRMGVGTKNKNNLKIHACVASERCPKACPFLMEFFQVHETYKLMCSVNRKAICTYFRATSILMGLKLAPNWVKNRGENLTTSANFKRLLCIRKPTKLSLMLLVPALQWHQTCIGRVCLCLKCFKTEFYSSTQ